MSPVKQGEAMSSEKRNSLETRNPEKSDYKRDSSDLLASLFGKTRRKILSLLYGHADESFHLRKVRSLTGVLPGAAQRELTKLSEAGIIRRTAKDNQVFFQADSKCPIFIEMKSIIMKTAGMADVLREALAPLSLSIKASAIFGSIARGREKKESDVDLLVIGDVKFSDVVEKLGPAQTLLNREINPFVLSVQEFQKRVKENDHFFSSVLESQLIPIYGTLNELI